jgi:hypothetical protein
MSGLSSQPPTCKVREWPRAPLPPRVYLAAGTFVLGSLFVRGPVQRLHLIREPTLAIIRLMIDDAVEDETPEPVPHDPTRGMRRLVLAILLQGVLDFTRAQDRETWSDAACFLFPNDPDRQEFLRWTVECSCLDPYRLHANLTRLAGKWSYRARSGR